MRSTNRKQFLQRMAAGGSLLAVPGLLAACGGGGIEGEDEATSAAAPAAPESSAASSAGGATSEAVESSAADAATSAPAETTAAASTGQLADKLRISNWTLYIDIDEKTNERPSLKAFEDESASRSSTLEDINSNEEFFGKVQAPLSQGPEHRSRPDGADRLHGRAARWSGSATSRSSTRRRSRTSKNLQPALRRPPYGTRTARMSMPWQSGFTGLAYDPEKVGKGAHVGRRPDNGSEAQGQVHPALRRCPTRSVSSCSAWASTPPTVERRDVDKALAKLEEMRPRERPPVHGQRLHSGMLASRRHLGALRLGRGDVRPAGRPTTPNLKFVVPEAGGVIWTDNMLIPKGGDVYTASVFMDYVYRPKVAAQIEAYVNYISPVVGAEEEMRGHRPGDRVEPADLPAAGHPRPGQGVRPQRLEQRGLQEEVRPGGRGLTPVRR